MTISRRRKTSPDQAADHDTSQGLHNLNAPSRRAARSSNRLSWNPLRALAIQVAFTVPLVLPLAGIAALYSAGLFYPACLIIVGAHYLPFVFMYGMKTFAVIAAVLVSTGFALGLATPDRVVAGGWLGGMILLVSAFGLLAAYRSGSEPGR